MLIARIPPSSPVVASPCALRCGAIGLHRTGGLEVRSSHTVGDLAVLEAAFAALEQGITIHDRDGRVVVANPAAARLIRLPLDEMLGEHPRYQAFDVRDERGRPVTPESSGIMQALERGETELGGWVELRPQGGGRSQWLRVNCQPLLGGPGQPTWGVVSSCV